MLLIIVTQIVSIVLNLTETHSIRTLFTLEDGIRLLFAGIYVNLNLS